jgi:hypothetical protein
MSFQVGLPHTIQYPVNDLPSKRHIPCTSSSICTNVAFHLSSYPISFYRARSLLAEGIGVAIQQLHDGSILGLQAPYFGAELYNRIDKPLAKSTP